MDRQLDVLLGFPPANCYPRCFFYGYAMRAPTSICLVGRRGRPVLPSFSWNWFSIFILFCFLSPFAITFCLVFTAHGHFAAQRKPSYSALLLFLVSTFFGRCPPQPVRPGAASATFIAAAWLTGTWLLLNFIQTDITASITAPEYSPEIRGIYEFAAQLDSGRMLPCTTRSVYNRSKVFDASVSYLRSLRDALKRCGKECYERQVWDSCAGEDKNWRVRWRHTVRRAFADRGVRSRAGARARPFHDVLGLVSGAWPISTEVSLQNDVIFSFA
ncbi:hypothetical protein MTO96_031002 [Rhipicephalus appendiculatus]